MHRRGENKPASAAGVVGDEGFRGSGSSHSTSSSKLVLGIVSNPGLIRQQQQILDRIERAKKKEDMIDTVQHDERASNDQHQEVSSDHPATADLEESDEHDSSIPQSMLEEQERLLSFYSKRKSDSSTTTHESKKSAPTLVDDEEDRSRKSTSVFYEEVEEGRKKSAAKDCTRPKIPSADDSEDEYWEDRVLTAGFEKLEVKGTAAVRRSMAEGTATLVRCPHCDTLQYVAENCTSLYCVPCQEVVPLELALELRRATTGDSSSCVESSDDENAVQRERNKERKQLV
jgi:hypothetical protein